MDPKQAAEEMTKEQAPVVEAEDTGDDDSQIFSEMADEMLQEEDDFSDGAPETDAEELAKKDEVVDEFIAQGAPDTSEETPEPEQEPTQPEPETPEAAAAEDAKQQETQDAQPEVPAQPAAEESKKEPGEEVDWEKMQADALTELEQRYQFSEEDAQALVTEPEKVLPKLASRLYYDAFQNISRGIMSALPGMISQTLQMQEAVKKSEDEFFGKWQGKLDRSNATHRETAERIARVYAQVNPSVTRERFIAEVGAQTLLALGIPFEQIVDAPEPETPVTPFRPAKPTGVAPRDSRQSKNEWSDLAEEFISEDQS